MIVDAELQEGLAVLRLLDHHFGVSAERQRGGPHATSGLSGVATQHGVGAVVVIRDPPPGLQNDLRGHRLDDLLLLGAPMPGHIAQFEIAERHMQLRRRHRLDGHTWDRARDAGPAQERIDLRQHSVVQRHLETLRVLQHHHEIVVLDAVSPVPQIQFPASVREPHPYCRLVVAEAAMAGVLLHHDVLEKVVRGQLPQRLDDHVVGPHRSTPVQVTQQAVGGHAERVRRAGRVQNEQRMLAFDDLDAHDPNLVIWARSWGPATLTARGRRCVTARE